MLSSWLLLAFGLLCSLEIANSLRPRSSILLTLASWMAAWVLNELAVHLLLGGLAIGGLLAAAGALNALPGVIGLVLLLLASIAIAPAAWHNVATRLVIEGRPAEMDLDGGPRIPRWHAFAPLFSVVRRGVRTETGREFAVVEGLRLRCNIYRAKRPQPGPRPAIINVHGGAWVLGSRREQALPLLKHLALNGWVAVNIDYRLSPRATLPEHVEDVKRAISWVRENARELGVDPNFIALTGGSAGGHLSALAALSSADPSLQRGFEHADTSVQAAVPFYGLYDLVDETHRHHPVLRKLLEWIVVKARADREPQLFRSLSPVYRIHADAPPFFIVHGSRDTLVPVVESRIFSQALRETSHAPVLYAEMKGAQHAFELLVSWRSKPVLESIERFLAATHADYLAGDSPQPALEPASAATTPAHAGTA